MCLNLIPPSQILILYLMSVANVLFQMHAQQTIVIILIMSLPCLTFQIYLASSHHIL